MKNALIYIAVFISAIALGVSIGAHIPQGRVYKLSLNQYQVQIVLYLINEVAE